MNGMIFRAATIQAMIRSDLLVDSLIHGIRLQTPKIIPMNVMDEYRSGERAWRRPRLVSKATRTAC